MKTKQLFVPILIIASVLLSIRLYNKKQQRERIEQMRQEQIQWTLEMRRKSDSIRRATTDSLLRVKRNTRLDSFRKLNQEKLRELQKIKAKLEQE